MAPSEGMYLAIAVNRPGEIDFESLVVPDALREQILELWVFGRIADPEWFFAGDLLVERRVRPVRIEDALPQDEQVHAG